MKQERKLLAVYVTPELFRAYKTAVKERGMTASDDLRAFVKLRVKHHRLEREGRGEEVFSAGLS